MQRLGAAQHPCRRQQAGAQLNAIPPPFFCGGSSCAARLFSFCSLCSSDLLSA